MIALLQGTILDIHDPFVIVDVQGVGYQVFCSQKTLRTLSIDTPSKLHIEMVVREDALQLFGFPDQNEKRAFQMLRTVQGVGAKMALSILSALSPEELAFVVTQQDKARLTQAEGVGPKLALRICTELKDKIITLQGSFSSQVIPLHQATKNNHEDVISALVNLGYKKSDASAASQKAYEDLNEENVDIETMIRNSLKLLAR